MRLLLALVLAGCASDTRAQRLGPPQPFVLGTTETIHSRLLGEDRVLNIHLPPAYHADTAATYPVIYLLDGSADEDFVHVVGGLQFASFPWLQWMPPSIVVGIANVDRKRDLTFPTTIAADKEQFPTTGGSQAFMEFLAKEVLPFVEREYRVSRERTLIGQSLGGLFATELLFRKPYLFTHYLIVSPSLWWDDGSLLQLDHTVLMAPDIGVASVYIVVGDEGRPMLRPAKRLAALLRKGSQARIGYQRIRGLDHSNILHRALMDYFQWRGGK